MTRYVPLLTSALLAGGILTMSIAGCGKDANPEGTAPPDRGVAQVANRGLFDTGACPDAERVAIPATSAFAVYFDQDGNEIENAPAEILNGTHDNKMCPVSPPPPDGADPGICTPLCAKLINKKTYCVPC